MPGLYDPLDQFCHMREPCQVSRGPKRSGGSLPDPSAPASALLDPSAAAGRYLAICAVTMALAAVVIEIASVAMGSQ